MAGDYYATLGVSRDATTEAIKKAFRRLARETHPDANPGDPEAEARFRMAAEAYEVLSDPERRRRYDRGDTIDLSDLFGGVGSIDDLLRSVFGESGLFGGGPRRPSRGRDVLVRAEITLEQAAFGSEVNVEYRTQVACRECSGLGAKPGTSKSTCPDCGGAGQVRVAQRSLFGTVMSVSTCPRCEGGGSVIDEPCEVCGGSGAVTELVSVDIEIPPGVSDGTRLRLSSRGESAGRRGAPGDLYVEVRIQADPRFERHDSDLWHRATIGVIDAVLGSELEVPLLEGGSHTVDIPAGTQPGEVFRVRGAGMTVLGRRGRGDLIVIIDVEIPTSVSVEEESLLRQWAEMRSTKVDRPLS